MMVKEVDLQPQGFRGFSSQGIGGPRPEDVSVPSLTGLGQTSLTGLEKGARATQSYAETATAIAGMFNTTAQDVLDRVRKKQELEAGSNFIKGFTSANAVITDVQRNSNSEDVIDNSLSAYDKFSEDYINNQDGLSDYQREILKTRFDGNRFNVAQQATAKSASLFAQEAKTAAQEYYQAKSLMVEQNSDLGTLEEQISGLDSDVGDLGANIDTSGLNKKLVDVSMRSRAKTDPVGLRADLEAGLYDKYLDGGEKLVAEDMANRALANRQLTPEQIQVKAELEARVAVEPESVSVEEITQQYESGLTSASEYESLLVKRNKALLEAKETTSSINDFISNVNNGVRPTMDDSKTIDKAYAKLKGDSSNPAQASQAVSEFVVSAGIMPKAMKNDIKSILSRGSAQEVGQMVDTYDKIMNSSVFLQNADLGAQEQAFIDQSRTILSYTPVEEQDKVINDLRRTMSGQNATVSAVTDQLVDDYYKEEADNIGERFVSALDDKAPILQFGGTLDPRQAPGLMNDVKAFAKTYKRFNPGATEEESVDKAIETIVNSGKWGFSDVGNIDNNVVKYPPERAFNVRAEYIEEDLKASLSSLGEIQDVGLIADTLTEKQIQSGKPASYAVTYIDESGITQWDTNRYSFDKNKFLEKAPKSLKYEVSVMDRSAMLDGKFKEYNNYYNKLASQVALEAEDIAVEKVRKTMRVTGAKASKENIIKMSSIHPGESPYTMELKKATEELMATRFGLQHPKGIQEFSDYFSKADIVPGLQNPGDFIASRLVMAIGSPKQSAQRLKGRSTEKQGIKLEENMKRHKAILESMNDR